MSLKMSRCAGLRIVEIDRRIDLRLASNLPGERGFDGLNSAVFHNDLMLLRRRHPALTPPLIVNEDRRRDRQKVAKVIRAVA